VRLDDIAARSECRVGSILLQLRKDEDEIKELRNAGAGLPGYRSPGDLPAELLEEHVQLKKELGEL
jgi:hypothetical protein